MDGESLGGIQFLRNNVCEPDAIAIADVENMASSRGNASRTGCRSSGQTLRLTQSSTDACTKSAEGRCHGNASSDRGVDASLLGSCRSISKSQSTGCRVHKADRIAVGNCQRRGGVGRNSNQRCSHNRRTDKKLLHFVRSFSVNAAVLGVGITSLLSLFLEAE